MEAEVDLMDPSDITQGEHTKRMITPVQEANFEDRTPRMSTTHSLSNDEVEHSHEQYLAQLWNPETVDYFFNPQFTTDDPSTKPTTMGSDSTISDTAKQLFLGGYPTGMLRGARVPYRADLKPWLTEAIALRNWQRRRSRFSRSWSTVSISSIEKHVQSRFIGLPTILDTLREQLGCSVGAISIWDLLRGKSHQMLTELEKNLDKDSRETFAAYTRERVMAGQENSFSLINPDCHSPRPLKPPLCDFLRENPAEPLMQSMQKLQAPRMEHEFRKTLAMARWAERNQDQFRVTAHQHNLRDLLSDEQVLRMLDNHHPHSEPIPEGLCVISQAEAEQLSHLLPPLQTRQFNGPFEHPKTNLEDLFPQNQIDAVKQRGTETKKKTPLKDPQSTRKTKPRAVESRVKQLSQRDGDYECMQKVSSQLSFLKSFRETSLDVKKSGRSGLQSSVQKLPDIKAKPALASADERIQRILDTDYTGETVGQQPLCWSQLIEQYSRVRHKHKDSDECHTDRVSAASDRSSAHHNPRFRQGCPNVWKPSTAVAKI